MFFKLLQRSPAPGVALLALALFAAPRASAQEGSGEGSGAATAPPDVPAPSPARLVSEAERALAAGHLHQAIETARLALRVVPGDVDVAITYAKMQAAAGNLEDALLTLRGFLPKYEGYGELRNAIARNLLWMGRREAAAAEARAALATGTDQAEATRLLAEIAFQSRNTDEAEAGYAAYLKLAPDDAAARTRYLQVLFDRDELARLSDELDALPPQTDDPQRASMRALLARRFLPGRFDAAATYTAVDSNGTGNADWGSIALATEYRGKRLAAGLGALLDTRRYGTRRVDFAFEPSLRYFPNSFYNTRLALAVAPNPEFMPVWALTWENGLELSDRFGVGAAYRISSYDLPAVGAGAAATPVVQLLAPFVTFRFEGFLFEPGVTAVFGDVASPPLLTYQAKGTLLLSDEERVDAWLLYGTEPFDQSQDPALLRAGDPQLGAYLGYTTPISHLASFKVSYAVTSPADTTADRATRVRHAITLGYTRRFGRPAPPRSTR